MKSEKPIDWMHAKQEYLDDLQRRYPNHPYQEKTKGWLDRIALNQIERRADVIEKPNLASFSKPKDDTERLYFDVYQEVRKQIEEGKEVDAIAKWKELGSVLAKHPEDRGWLLLSQKRSADLELKVADRKREAQRLLDKAEDHVLNGRLKEAAKLLKSVVEEFSRNPELAEIVDKAKTKLEELPKSEIDEPEKTKPADSTVEDPAPKKDPDPKPEDESFRSSLDQTQRALLSRVNLRES